MGCLLVIRFSDDRTDLAPMARGACGADPCSVGMQRSQGRMCKMEKGKCRERERVSE